MAIKRTTEIAIENLTDDAKLQLIADYEQFELNGSIGDCSLRKLAESLPGCGNHVIMYMNVLANECYRYFANKWLSNHGF